MTGETKTLRCRMLLVAVACVITMLAVAGAALVVVFDRHMLQAVGKDLDARWADLARDLVFDADGRPRITMPDRDSRYGKLNGGAYWQVSDGEQVLLRSSSLGQSEIDVSHGGAAREAGTWFDVATPDGHELYVVEREVPQAPKQAKQPLRLAVALDHAQIADAREDFQWDMFFILGLIALVLVAGAGLQLRVILSPLSRLRAELADIREGAKARLTSPVPDEVAPLAADLNRLLDGQEDLVKKARERAGALAHGLKTPLAILSAECRRIEEDGHGDNARRLREQISAIQTHVERELARARTHGAAAALGAYVDAPKTAERLVRVMSRMPRGETLEWRCETPDELMLRMDPDDFGEVLGNLLDNARKWAVGAVTLRCEMSRDAARVIVEDDGPGFGSNAAPTSLTAGDRESSAGLGLIIVQDILATYGSALWIDRASRHGVVSFFLPRRLSVRTEGAPAESRSLGNALSAGVGFRAPSPTS